MIPSPKSLLALAMGLSLASAVKFPIERRTSHGIPFKASVPSLLSLHEGGGGSGSRTGDILNVNDLLYTVDITICGLTVTVQLDTGSTGGIPLG